jgi:hypothetical protein
MGLTIGTDTHPRVFFVPCAAALGKRGADKGLALDAASRTSTLGEPNAEAQRGRENGAAFTTIQNGSTSFYYCQGLL